MSPPQAYPRILSSPVLIHLLFSRFIWRQTTRHLLPLLHRCKGKRRIPFLDSTVFVINTIALLLFVYGTRGTSTSSTTSRGSGGSASLARRGRLELFSCFSIEEESVAVATPGLPEEEGEREAVSFGITGRLRVCLILVRILVATLELSSLLGGNEVLLIQLERC